MAKFEPNVSIIIPIRNAERTLDTTIQYLLNIEYPTDKIEILLADGGSSDGTVKIIKSYQKKYPFIKLIEVPDSKSPGHARNAAIKEVKGEFVLFTDGDCAPSNDWVHQMVTPFEKNEKIGGVGGEVLTLRVESENHTESYCEQTHFLSPIGRCGLTESGHMPTLKNLLPHEVNGGDNNPFFATANFAVRKKAIDEIGGKFWDEPTGEDVDFNLRILKAGYTLYLQKEGVVKHMHRVDLKSFRKQLYGYGYGHPLLINRHAKNKVLELYLQIGKGISIPIPFFMKGIIHIGNYHLMNFFLKLTLISYIVHLLTSSSIFSSIAFYSFIIFILFTVLYFLPILKLRPLTKFFTFARIRYTTNSSFIKGGLDAQRKFGAICIEPSF